MPLRNPQENEVVDLETFGLDRWPGPPLLAAVPETGHNGILKSVKS